MSNLIIVLGESGTGKSTSMRNLNPTETYIINVLSKPLPIRGYKNSYSTEKKNFLESDNHSKILDHIRSIDERGHQIKTLIIDDFSFLTNNLFMRRLHEKNWDKFNDIGSNTFHILEACKNLREDLYCFIMCHTEKSEAGALVPKKVGTMVGKYVGMEERVSVVLHTQIVDQSYKFLTQHDGERMAKSPPDMFSNLYIDNDLNFVKSTINNYYNDADIAINEGE